MRIVIATANPDKAREIGQVLAGAGVDLVPRPPDVPDVDETEDTLLGNARLKARALCAATGLPALADDTGLEVEQGQRVHHPHGNGSQTLPDGVGP